MHKGERRRAGMKARKSKRRFTQAGTMYNQRFYREKLSNKVEKRGILGRLLFVQGMQKEQCVVLVCGERYNRLRRLRYAAGAFKVFPLRGRC